MLTPNMKQLSTCTSTSMIENNQLGAEKTYKLYPGHAITAKYNYTGGQLHRSAILTTCKQQMVVELSYRHEAYTALFPPETGHCYRLLMLLWLQIVLQVVLLVVRKANAN